MLDIKAHLSAILTGRQIEGLLKRVLFGEGCWEWTGYTDANGNPEFAFRPKTTPRSPRRLMYMAVKGEVPSGWVVKNTCGNRLCVNPDHLNVIPRSAAAPRAGTSRMLTETEKCEIYADSMRGASIADLARKYRVTTVTIRKTLKNYR